MSENFNQFIVGTLLGDSSISKEGSYAFTHSTKQLGYFLHKVSALRDFGMRVGVSKYSPTGFSTNSSLRASCHKVAIFKPLRELFYPSGNKIVPKSITITPIVLAYWFMDDGNANLIKHYNSVLRGRVDMTIPVVNKFRLYTDGFDDRSQEVLSGKLRDLGIKSGFYTRKNSGNKYIEIRDRESKQRLKELISPYVVESMRYKIDYEVSFQRERLNERAPVEDTGDAIVRSYGNENRKKLAEMTSSVE